MTSISLCTYSSNNEKKTEELLLIDFELDYADVFPSPQHMERFLQEFFDLIWKSHVTDVVTSATTSSLQMKNFKIIGGDEETLDLQYDLVVDQSSTSSSSITTTTKVVQAFLPEFV